MKAVVSSLRLILRKGWGVSRPNLDLDHADLGRTRGVRWFKMQFQRFLEVCECLVFGLTLACDIEFQALSNIPLAFTPNSRSEWSLHVLILSHSRRSSEAKLFGSWLIHGLGHRA